MSEVQRLSLDMKYPFQYMENNEGNLCYYADYAAIKAERDALAAEAGYLRGEIKQHSESVHFCGVCGKDDPCKNDDVCWSLNHPTPATDAYLNSVRAEGVDMFISELAELFKTLKTGGKPWQAVKGIAMRAASFAAQLRAGEPS